MIPSRRIYLNEYNILMGKSTYLPFVSGILRAHSERSDTVRDSYQFMPNLFHLAPINSVVDQYQNPSVAAFSVSMWNEQMSLRVAHDVKQRFPNCVVIFGGAQVPHDGRAYLLEHDFIDFAVRGEGEESFTEILERLTLGQDQDGIPGITWRTQSGEIRFDASERPFNRDLDDYPSPYLEGMFDELLETRRDLTFQAIIETNRGCPFKCTFCYWGKGGLSRKYRYHGMDRVKAEIDWLGQRGIRYVFNADSNFGMHRRDKEIAEYLVETKKRYGAPEKFRTCYGKNTDEKIYEIGSLFRENDMEKGITISYQSYDETVQKNIKRGNIKIATATELQRKFNAQKIPVYTELILGLPGETVRSWVNGIDRILESGLKNQLFIYICQVFPNTELADPDYQKQFGINTQRIEITEIHGSIRDPEWVPEYEDIVISTNSMSMEDWRRSLRLSWVTMVFHSMKLGFFLCAYLHRRHNVGYTDFLMYIADSEFNIAENPILAAEVAVFDRKIDLLFQGGSRGTELSMYGDFYWDEEEASFLRISEKLEVFYEELSSITATFLKDRNVAFDAGELAEVVRYQMMRIPMATPPLITDWTFSSNIPIFFENFFDEKPVDLASKPTRLETDPTDYGDDLTRFARESVLWARKSGTNVVPCRILPAL
jgi:radical SAM superfamily enzyme YgiQ (UPF0313 family)